MTEDYEKIPTEALSSALFFGLLGLCCLSGDNSLSDKGLLEKLKERVLEINEELLKRLDRRNDGDDSVFKA